MWAIGMRPWPVVKSFTFHCWKRSEPSKAQGLTKVLIFLHVDVSDKVFPASFGQVVPGVVAVAVPSPHVQPACSEREAPGRRHAAQAHTTQHTAISACSHHDRLLRASRGGARGGRYFEGFL